MPVFPLRSVGNTGKAAAFVDEMILPVTLAAPEPDHTELTMSAKPVTEKLIAIITRTSTFLAVVSLFSMMLLITLDVILNKLAGRPIQGTIELTSYYFMVFVVFLTLPYLEKQHSHISADFIVARFSPKIQNIFNIIGKLLTALFYSFLTYAAFNQAIKSTKSLETVMSNFTFYIWPARWGVTLGLVFAIAVIMLYLAQNFRNNPHK